jgi:hypothetical protein
MALVDAPVVFRDLCDVHRDLSQSVHSPREVRRLFSRYVELSQRLTSAMRKDFGGMGKKRVASGFQGWSEKTDLLKHLRNEEQHNNQIFLHVNERLSFRLPDDIEVHGLPREFVVHNTWLLTDQQMEEPPTGLEVALIDPGSAPGGPKSLLPPVSLVRRYVIVPRDDATKRLLEVVGTSDVHEIAQATMSILTAYFEYFVSLANTS